MRHPKLFAAFGIAAALALAAPDNASAQSRARGRAVPRASVRPSRPPSRVVVVPRYYPSYRRYYPSANFGFFYGYPGYYGPYAWGSPYYYGYAPYGYAYRPDWPYGYGYSGYRGRAYGGVRIDVPQRDAEVYVDGYFVGQVDDFDGRLQQANLEAGPHQIEVRKPGFETITFEVNVEPGRTITYRSSMRPDR
jgi:hypothetical protein